MYVCMYMYVYLYVCIVTSFDPPQMANLGPGEERWWRVSVEVMNPKTYTLNPQP